MSAIELCHGVTISGQGVTLLNLCDSGIFIDSNKKAGGDAETARNTLATLWKQCGGTTETPDIPF